MNSSLINPKRAVAECDLGKGQIATQNITRDELLVVVGGRMMMETFDLLSET